MKKMLFVQNVQVAPQKPNKKSEKKRKKLRGKVFNIVFRGIEALWMLLQIVQYLLQILSKRIATEKPI